MTDYILYHNPRCSKSRQTLALLEENGIEPKIIRYLETPPDAATLTDMVNKLQLDRAHDLVRVKEADYNAAGLQRDSSDADVISAMVNYPKLMERPILVCGQRAAIGRPPENVLTLLE